MELILICTLAFITSISLLLSRKPKWRNASICGLAETRHVARLLKFFGLPSSTEDTAVIGQLHSPKPAPYFCIPNVVRDPSENKVYFSKSTPYFRLPNLIPGPEWPFKSPPHPLQQQMVREGLDWVRSLEIYNERILERFHKYRTDALVAWSYRHQSVEHYRCCADFMYMFWIVDDCMDNHTQEEAANEVKHILQALRDPYGSPLPNESMLGKVLRSFWRNVTEKINPTSATKARFLKDFIDYLNALPEEAADRASGRLRNLDEHFELRRQTGGLQPSFVFNVMHMDFPEDVSEHPHIVRMKMATGDLVIIANDVYSWNVEQAGGQMRVAHNIVDVFMREKRLSPQQAMDAVGVYYHNIWDQLKADYNALPDFGDENKNRVASAYAIGCLEWVEGNVEFSLASGRYFKELAGDKTIRKTRWVPLMPLKVQ